MLCFGALKPVLRKLSGFRWRTGTPLSSEASRGDRMGYFCRSWKSSPNQKQTVVPGIEILELHRKWLGLGKHPLVFLIGTGFAGTVLGLSTQARAG